MVEEQKFKKSIQAVQDLIIEARRMASEGTSNEDLADFLDGVEYLPGLIVETEDRTEVFENYLKMICAEKKCMSVLNRYAAR